MKPERYPDHIPEGNNLFMKMVKNFRGHILLNCEASSLLTHKEYIEKNGWKMCSNDSTDLCCMARLGHEGSIRQIAGPNEKNSEDIWNGPKRRVLQFLKFLEVHLLFPILVISHVKILKITKK